MAEQSGALRDMFANIMTFDVTETAAGTLTFGSVETNVGIDSNRRTGVAVLIDQIDYFVHRGAATLLLDESDEITYGITISNGVTNMRDMSDRRILHSDSLFVHDVGTAASSHLWLAKQTNQFFPPLIMAERQIFLGVVSSSLASAAQVRARIYYRTTQITSEQFVEIAEVFRLVS